jgi:hypothetical protein
MSGATTTHLKAQLLLLLTLDPSVEELVEKVLSETTDTVCATPTVDDAAVSTYD